MHSVNLSQSSKQLCAALQHNKYVTFKAVSECTDDVNRWFLENKLLLNLSKMLAMLYGTLVQCNKVNALSYFEPVLPSGELDKLCRTALEWKLRALLSNSATIKLLGVKLDPDISMNRHVTELV